MPRWSIPVSLVTMVEPGAQKVLRLIERARPHATISYDPNIRPSLITDHSEAVAKVERFVALADAVRASDSDLEWLYPQRSVEDTAAAWLELGPAMVVATYGSRGPWGLVASGTARAAAPLVDVADTVGAGDSFISAMILGPRGPRIAWQRTAGEAPQVGHRHPRTDSRLRCKGCGHHRFAGRGESAVPRRNPLAGRAPRPMSVRLIASDLDGTIIREDGTISGTHHRSVSQGP